METPRNDNTGTSRRSDDGHEQDQDAPTPHAESSIAARRAAADPDSDEISGDTPESRMPQL